MTETKLRWLSFMGLAIGAVSAATLQRPPAAVPTPAAVPAPAAACGMAGCHEACATPVARASADDCGIPGCHEPCGEESECGPAHSKAPADSALHLPDSVASASRCSAFGACAIGTDLSEATGPLLAKYRQQKSEDGQTFRNRPAPDFHLKDLDGRTVSLADLRGQRVALVFWQSHCSHSMKSLPTWSALSRELAPQLRVVTVLFNGGDAAYVKAWYGPKNYQLPVLLAPDDALAEAYGSHLVPSVFLVNERGQLVKKLVSQQSPEALKRELTAFAHGA